MDMYMERLAGERLAEIERLEKELASLPAKWSQDSSLETWFPLTSEELENLRKEVAELRAFKQSAEAKLKEYEQSLKLSGEVNAKLMQELLGKQVVWIPDVDWLAAVIRKVDGKNLLGAGAMAEKIVDEMLAATPSHSQQSAEYRCHKCNKVTPPPEPFKFYVRCACGAATAATVALVGDSCQNQEPKGA